MRDSERILTVLAILTLWHEREINYTLDCLMQLRWSKAKSTILTSPRGEIQQEDRLCRSSDSVVA